MRQVDSAVDPEPIRCAVCGLPMHRFGFDGDMRGADRAVGDGSDGRSHEPTAVACANSIIAEIDRMLGKGDIDARDHVQERVENAVTAMAFALDRMANP